MEGPIAREGNNDRSGHATEEHRFLSQLLRECRDKIAEDAAYLLVSRWTDLANRYQPLALERWRETMRSRLDDLASAVLSACPRVFVDQVAWSRVAFEARGVPTDDLQRSLDALGEVLERNVPPEDVPLLHSYVQAAGRVLHEKARVEPSELTAASPHGTLAARYLLRVLEGDRRGACALLVEAVRAGTLSAFDVYEHVLSPVQHEIGRLWHIGDVSVVEEHFCTATTHLAMAHVAPLLPNKARNGRTIIAASVEGNAHDIGVRMVADYFEADGWRAISLGHSVPSTDLAIAVKHYHADLVALSVYLPSQVGAAEEAIEQLRAQQNGKRVVVMVGGPAFRSAPSAWRQIGADVLATNAREAVRLAQEQFPN